MPCTRTSLTVQLKICIRKRLRAWETVQGTGRNLLEVGLTQSWDHGASVKYTWGVHLKREM